MAPNTRPAVFGHRPREAGLLNFEGEEFPGRHAPLIDEALFDRVQAIIQSRGIAGERRCTHHHFLKGTVYCGECRRLRGVDQRLLIQHVIGRNGGEYFYYFCPNRTEGTCHQPHHDVYRVEEAVERHYRRKHFSDKFIELVRKAMPASDVPARGRRLPPARALEFPKKRRGPFRTTRRGPRRPSACLAGRIDAKFPPRVAP